MATDDNIKTLSRKIDDAIEGVLHFMLRYVRTSVRISARPWRPTELLESAALDPSPVVRPLTYLGIGAFLFAIVIEIYPHGLFGLADSIWFVNEIRSNLSSRWKEALSVTTLITAGLPTVLSVAVVAGISGRVLFPLGKQRDAWFSICCFAFGYQAVGIFIVLSLETVIDGMIAAIPWLSNIYLPEPYGGWSLIAIVLGFLTATLVGPLILLAAYLREKRAKSGKSNLSISVVIAMVILALGTYIYSAAASVLPQLGEKYFPEPEPSIEVVSDVELNPRDTGVVLDFEILFSNPTMTTVYEQVTDQSKFSLSVGRGPDEAPIEEWSMQYVLITDESGLSRSTKGVIVHKESSRLISIRTIIDSVSEICDRYGPGIVGEQTADDFEGSYLGVFLSITSTISGGNVVRTRLDESALCTQKIGQPLNSYWNADS